MKVAIVGAGPAGALSAALLARDGAHAVVFDASHPREKPCGGGLTAKALRLLPPAPADDPLPVRLLDRCRFDSGAGDSVEVRLDRPVGIASRRALDAWLLRRAVAAGAVHVAERVIAVDAAGRVRTTTGRDETFDLVVGADGAGSLVRRSLLSPTPASRLMMAAGWFARGDAEMVVRFTPDLRGYLWLFPRPGHVGVGICAPLARVPTARLLDRLASEVARAFPALADDEAPRYAHTIPSPSADPKSLLEVAGERWALVATPPPWPTPSPARASTTACARPRSWPRPCAKTAPPAAIPNVRWRRSAASCSRRRPCTIASTPRASRAAWSASRGGAASCARCSRTSFSASRDTRVSSAA